MQRALDAMFERATAARVIDGGVSNGQPIGSAVLLQVDRSELPRLRGLLRVHDGPAFHCMCLGDLAIELVGAEGGAIGVHHGRSLRLHGLPSDAELADGRALLQWLADRGVPGPLADFDRAAEAAAAASDAYRDWLEAAPPPLAPLLPGLSGGMGLPVRGPAYADVAARLVAAYGSRAIAARALLAWWGPREGDWTSCPAYETVAETLLGELGVSAVVETLEGADDATRIGAARFLCAWDVWKGKKRELSRVPDAVWDALLDIVRQRRGTAELRRLEHTVRELRADRAARAAKGPVRHGDALLVGVADGGMVSIASCARGVLAIDGAALACFEPGSTERIELWVGPDRFGYVGAAGGEAFVAHINAGTVTRVDVASGEATTIASGRPRPLHPVAGPWWLEAEQYIEPGTIYTKQRSRIAGLAGSEVIATAWADVIWSLVTDGVRPFWLERVSDGVALQSLDGGTVRTLAVLRLTLDLGKGWPALAATPRSLYATDPVEAAVLRVHEGGRAERIWKARGGFRASGIIADDAGLFVWAEHDRTMAIVAIDPDGDGRVLLRAPMEPGDRAVLALDRERVYWTSGHRVLAFERG